MPGLRQQGVFGVNLPVRRAASVSPAAMAIAGIIAKMERKFDQAFAVNTQNDVLAIFGGQVDPASYGPDSVDGFFKNLGGQPGTLYLYSPPNAAAGSPGALTDTQASMQLPDTMATQQKPITLSPAYQGYAEYGVGGNRTGAQIEVGDRFVTSSTADTSASAVKIFLASVADFNAGDVIKMACSKGTVPATVYGVINEVNQAGKYLGFAATPFSAAAFLGNNDAVTIPGFRVHTYRKDALTGMEQEVDIDLGRKWLGLNPAAPNYYPPNVFAGATWLSVAVNTTTSTPDKKMPAAQAATLYPTSTAPTGGTFTVATDGASMTAAAQWYRALHAFDGLPVRALALCETTDQPTQQLGENYCFNRTTTDNPLFFAVLPEAQTKAQLIQLGNNFARSSEVDAVLVGHWGLRQDPFQSSPVSAPRHVPLAGHALGLFCQGLGINGVHASIAQKGLSIQGLVGISGTQFNNPVDRTDLANAGVNCVEYLPGYGYVLRNYQTPSTDPQYQFADAVVHRNFVKISCVGSLQGDENTPNSLNRIDADRSAILNFHYAQWLSGSTGNVPLGETYGQTFGADGNPTKFEDHVEVRADIVNNPVAQLQAGNRNLDTYFTHPSPAGSIRIGVGLWLKG